ncbi:MAG: hypothetical protein HC875_37405 [Anaerolineales bacterium]|nr:hypothetical protein [Anaerolineales bacterium]
MMVLTEQEYTSNETDKEDSTESADDAPSEENKLDIEGIVYPDPEGNSSGSEPPENK